MAATGADSGFTLVEIMVALLVLAVLLAIAIPSFISVTRSADDRAAQSNLNTALVNAKAQFQKNGHSHLTSANLASTLPTAEPSLAFQTTASASQDQVSVSTTGDGSALVLAVYSAQTKNCWIVVDAPTKPDGTTAPVGPFGATQAPTVAVFPAATTPTTATSITFAQSRLGPTYAEIKTTVSGTQSTGDCVAGAPEVDANTTYAYSYASFPSI